MIRPPALTGTPPAGSPLNPESEPPLPSSPPSSRRRIPPEASRRILLAAQGLASPPARRGGPATVRTLIGRLGFLQVDSINVLERAHHLTLHTRLETYRPASLTRLLERDRTLFEHWTHDASVIPLEMHAQWKPRFRRHESRLEHGDWWRRRLGGEDPGPLLDRVLKRVRRDGPLRGRDLDEERNEEGGGPWWNWHPGKAALEYHWRTGRLAISHRVGFEKFYDLAERVHPAAHRAAAPTAGEHLDWACRSALERLGVATPGEIAAFWNSIPVADARRWCADAVERGEFEPVMLDDLDGRTRPALATEESDRWARTEPWSDECRLLCPFDPVIRDRRRIERRFGFDYRFEAFVPAAKRQFGYYVLPILHGERFVGRIDPRFDRGNGVIEVRGPWWEPKRGGPADRRRLDRALDRLAAAIGADQGWRRVRQR